MKRVIGPDGSVERVEFRDRPLNADEKRVFAKYRDLSPVEILRRLRTAEWNAAVAHQERDQWKTIAQRTQNELAVAERKLAALTPEGWEVPKTVADLVAHAEAHGWRSSLAWNPRAGGEEMALAVLVGRDLTPEDEPARGTKWCYRLTWNCVPGSARRAGTGVAQTPHRPQWHDAPSVRKIREVIHAHPGPGAPADAGTISAL
ncbi:hypothetical protein [Streptomyces nanshensis]|uniref:Uncharacterized protein n=1 Tax=Streptomyces nanshensis TaxID=518642 RepID=A0A1E7LBT3_9ACTN|nr:hypothetical protein [Streptomyces nanshensis]OEV13624.1 hypothetical protein AN218_02670 [Streptomyces nanshensis]